MPIGYLVTTAVIAWCTALALQPPSPRHSSTSNAAYWFTFLVNELPFVAFAWLAASTALALAQDDLFTPVGLVGLAVAVLASIGLGLVARRALPARAALAQALDAEIGLEPAPRHRPSARVLPPHQVGAAGDPGLDIVLPIPNAVQPVDPAQQQPPLQPAPPQPAQPIPGPATPILPPAPPPAQPPGK